MFFAGYLWIELQAVNEIVFEVGTFLLDIESGPFLWHAPGPAKQGPAHEKEQEDGRQDTVEQRGVWEKALDPLDAGPQGEEEHERYADQAEPFDPFDHLQPADESGQES